jgi:hypothetical protein
MAEALAIVVGLGALAGGLVVLDGLCQLARRWPRHRP